MDLGLEAVDLLVVVAVASCLSSEVRSARASASARWSPAYWSLTSWLASVRETTVRSCSDDSWLIVCLSAALGTLSWNSA